MKVLVFIVMFVICGCVLAQTQHQQEGPSKDYIVLIRQWADISDFAKNASEMTVNRIMRDMSKDPKLQKLVSKELTADLKQFFYEQFSSEEMMLQLAIMYQDYFTIEEMMDLIRFYNTPLGQKVIKSNEALAQKSQQVGTELLKKHEKGYMQIIAKHIKNAQENHSQDNPK